MKDLANFNRSFSWGVNFLVCIFSASYTYDLTCMVLAFFLFLQHYLLQNDLHPPQIEIKLTAAGIEEVRFICQAYEARTMEAKTKELNEKEFQVRITFPPKFSQLRCDLTH